MRNPRLLSEEEFTQMMCEFDQAGDWMRTQLRTQEPACMERHVISLERHNLPELEVVERLAATLGAEAFEVEVQRLASLHTIDLGAPVQSIARFTHPSLIGMSDAPFDVLSRVCDQLVIREPALLERPSYRCRHSHGTALPLALWLDLVRFAREEFDPAKWDAEFLVQKQRSGLSIREAFDALIAFKRANK
jgi:hypothetical protein